MADFTKQDRVAAEIKSVPASKLVIENVSKVFTREGKAFNVLENINLHIEEGEFVCLVGPSGCGKSTLLNLIAGLDSPTSGAIYTNGSPVYAPGRDRMMMFQEHALFPWLDVLGNVMFGLKLKPNLNDAERREVAKYYLHLVGLEKFMHAAIHELSGGMRQRVALARSLAPNPTVLLMDEPFGALDALTRENLYRDLQKIWQQRKKTIVFVTHNIREAVCLGDRVLLFSPNPGTIQEEFKIDLPRLRDINNSNLSERSAIITAALKKHLDAKGVQE
ncbi:MAG: ABC transporter ATP-binding protein [Opitutales bacterium]|nr:ABC transporter ATP-binding protein [Opitutales bacterium]